MRRSRDQELAPASKGLIERPWIVVGDVHLHEGIDPSVGEDLARLVRDVTKFDADALLVFNGDTIDLDRVRGEAAGGVGEAKAAARLDRVLSQFQRWVKAVRDHIARGGRAVFVAGNHDAELLLTSVRDVLRRHFGDVDVIERLHVGERVIEHGHQTDPDSAFHPDPRTALSKNRLSAFPLASLMTRMLLSDIPRFELSGDNHVAPIKVLARVLRDYKLAAIEMVLRFPVAGMRVLWHSLLARVRDDVPRDPAVSMSSPMRAARRLYLDRYFAVVFGFPLALAVLTGVAPTWVAWPVGVVALALVVPPKRRKSFAHRDVRSCRVFAAELAHEGKKLVVLGHVHRAFVEPTAAGGVYANHGAFSNRTSDGCRSYVRVEPNGCCCAKAFFCPAVKAQPSIADPADPADAAVIR